MKKRVSTLLLLILLSQAFILPLTAPVAEAATRVQITFAAGGAACGIFFFIRYTFRVSWALDQYREEAPALVNRSPAGWQITYPDLQFRRDERLAPSPPEHPPAPETVHLDILRWRF